MVGLDEILREAEKVSEEEAWRRLEALYKTRKIKRIYKRAKRMKYNIHGYRVPRINEYLIDGVEMCLERGLIDRTLPDSLTAAVFEYYKRNPEYKKTVDFILDKIHPRSRDAILKIWDGLGEKVYNMFSEFFGVDVGEIDAFKDYADYIMNESLKWIERFFRTGKEEIEPFSYKQATDMLSKESLDLIGNGIGINVLYKNGGTYKDMRKRVIDLGKLDYGAELRIDTFGQWIAEVSKVYMAKVDEDLRRNGFTF
ncbi:hypothetical protein [Pyrococcus yayanosii]|uniref:Uncharacterized protein n=1 Tax=Pyrococcus yayanosii (strain CH1 / JCM 16557) TaxID=529709 RepID=F8AE92_PYRYC|nr:hypothetical protein [Pyrococcus yayanosii]AEH24603.1 hypothetical protein PYCH_09180 [Pyrococcus yayanosii CH1]